MGSFNDYVKQRMNKQYGFVDPLTKQETIEKLTIPEPAPEPPEEKWIWVDGYKGTDKDMKCRGYQYELGKRFDIPEGEVAIPCHNGFHLCPRLDQVFGYYEVRDNNRFFKVKALVREKDVPAVTMDPNDMWKFSLGLNRDKLVAKSIIFEREMTVDEILTARDVDFSEWTEEDKLQALDKGPGYVAGIYRIRNLVKAGYSEAFAVYLIQEGYYKDALAVASQPDLSMDMRVAMLIANHRE